MKEKKTVISSFLQSKWGIILIIIGLIGLVIVSNLYLQWCQNNLSVDLAFKFAFSWHTEKFFLGSLVLGIVLLFFISLLGSLGAGALIYSVSIVALGYADYLKMVYRQEPIYPDDLKMIMEWGLLKDMVGAPIFMGLVTICLLALIFAIWMLIQSRKRSRMFQGWRALVLVVSIGLLAYVGTFNQSDNLLRKAYNKTALWIPYSQKMNYYNTGFIGGFLYNLKVDAMDEPAGYSKKAVEKIVATYIKKAEVKNNQTSEEKPNIVFVMSESFSDPSRLNGVTVTGDPLAAYYDVANNTYSGTMLSQNYGGGTANIEFEALTGLSMELMNPQMTTPYTMLVPKIDALPSIVSLVKQRAYATTAIHPYNTSMYKRKDVYSKLGFDQFLDEETMNFTEKIENNPYISDAAAYAQVTKQLAQTDVPQFVHLVTMQTHMPYDGKYTATNYPVITDGNIRSIEQYTQDIAYSSQAVKDFIDSLNQFDRRTLVVFWGDHLPGIYTEAIQAANEEATLHQTQFFIYDSKADLLKKYEHDTVTSPFYFAADLFEQAQLNTTGFYQLLLAMQETVPAFEQSLYYQNGNWKKVMTLSTAQKELYQAYQMIQYDIVSGKQYSLNTDFFLN